MGLLRAQGVSRLARPLQWRTDRHVLARILYFASPFFRAILDGGWKETQPAALDGCSGSEREDESDARSSTPSSHASDDGKGSAMAPTAHLPTSPRASFHTAQLVLDPAEGTDAYAVSVQSTATTDVQGGDVDGALGHGPSGLAIRSQAREAGTRTRSVSEPASPTVTPKGLASRLQRMATPPLPDKFSAPRTASHASQPCEGSTSSKVAEAHAQSRAERQPLWGVAAIIELSEEDPSTFQDVLRHIYPRTFALPSLPTRTRPARSHI